MVDDYNCKQAITPTTGSMSVTAILQQLGFSSREWPANRPSEQTDMPGEKASASNLRANLRQIQFRPILLIQMDTTDKFDFITHVDTRHLRWARTFASLIAFTHQRDELRPPDLIAGIYVANFERVAGFWPRPDLFEDFVAEKCNWSEPRWLTWQRWEFEFRHAPRNLGVPFTSWFVTLPRKSRFVGRRFKLSDDWKKLFALGEHITAYRGDFQGRSLPLLTPEVMLLATIRSQQLPIAKALLESRVIVDKVEEAAIRHVENPEHLRF